MGLLLWQKNSHPSVPVQNKKSAYVFCHQCFILTKTNTMNNHAFTPEEIAQLRADTPGTANLIHFNNAGASLPALPVLNAVTAYLQEEALTGGYETEDRYQQELQNAYNLIAKLINADAAEIALVENASTAWCIAFHGIDFKEGDEVIVSELEYVTNMIGFINAEKLYGIKFSVIPNNERGNFQLDQLERAINPRTRLIAVTHIASATGSVLPIEAIGEIAARHKVLYLVDACQSAGQLPLDVRAIHCDFLSVTGRKYLRAPRGTGFLYVKQEVQSQLKALFIDGRAIEWINQTTYHLRNDAKRFELYEKNRALTLGLAKAVEYALNIGMNRIWQRINFLSTLLRDKLAEIPGVTVQDIGDNLSGIVTFSVADKNSQSVKQQLSRHRINVSVGFAKSTPLFMDKHGLQSVVRASVHYYNTEDEIVKFCEVVGLEIS
jgi:selenocysteine lyase/cysteine desulfurase